MFSVTAAIMLLGLITTVSGVTDLTRTAESAGDPVVTATLAQIHEMCLFKNDYLFLRRLAFVASKNGIDQSTYRPGFDGGIWQISRNNYELTKNLSSVNYERMNQTLNVNWRLTKWSDLRKPLYSGLAAILTLTRLSPIPKDLTSQSKFYEEHLSGKASFFNSRVSGLDIDCQVESLDMAFVLDASGSIDQSEYNKSKQFTANVLSGFNVNSDAVRVAVMSFSDAPHLHFGFNDYNTTRSAQDAILKIPKISGGTNTGQALDFLRKSVFTERAGSREDAARIAIIQTDGQSNSKYVTIKAAELLRDEGILVFAIGIGNGVDISELDAIASPPTCTHVRLINDFTELNSMVSDLKSTACKTEVVQKTNTDNNYECSGQKAIKVVLDPETSIVFYPDQGKVDVFGSFKTTEPNSAFADFASVAAEGKPTIVYVADSKKPLYLSVSAKLSEKNQCNSTYLVKTISTNALKKTGASNLCIKNSQIENCTDIDYVKSEKFVTADSDNLKDKGLETICNKGFVGYRSHPDTNTKYVYCALQDLAYIVDCPQGFAYLESEQDCIVPASLGNGSECQVCSTNNWEIGLRKFPLLNKVKYIKCNGVETCSVEMCAPGSTYIPDDQRCSNTPNSSCNIQGSCVIVLVVLAVKYLLLL